MSETIIMSIIMPIILALVTAFVTASATLLSQRKKFQNELKLQHEQFQNELKRDFELDREKVRTEFMAEQVAKQLLEFKGWKQRSFKEIKGKLGGFEDNELRKILIRAGAVKFKRREDSEELWGLLSKNKEEFK